MPPKQHEETRRLAAIMFTDIHGYSRMMQQDERRTLAMLDEHNELLFPLIEARGGTVIKTVGNAILAVDAVGGLYTALLQGGFCRELSLETKASSPLAADQQDARIAADPLVHAFTRQAFRGVPMDNSPWMALIWRAFNITTMKRLLSGDEDPTPLLAALQRAVEKKLEATATPP
jgi:class 3 adenylate cyclase